ncbi:hypothetical protein HWV07_03380 [Natronomonas salina]|uniref:alpha-L-rhamnosidase-related protein n=1 Tax=Natronomonas salina TaxID=1710540 RepID=UPI0015B5313A|nr:hypothetical protein [Natronomonas salina]QLD88128.1 hypothetical protein HWV07_03380 [Natronomonas salina]
MPDDPSRRSLLRAVGAAGVAPALLGSVDGNPLEDTVGDLREQDPGIENALVKSVGCVKPQEDPELYGPTDIHAQSGNRGLSVALNDEGMITVLKWPSPSFYDHVKYHTTSRDEPRWGVAQNEGAFLGLVVDGETTWLRELATEQSYEYDRSDSVETVHRDDERGLTVRVRSVVARESDTFVRGVTVERDSDAPTDVRLVAFANVNPVTTKHVGNPTQDWCFEEANDGLAQYDAESDAVVFQGDGVDDSTGERSRVALAWGFDGETTAHHVGGDAHDPAAAPAAAGPTRDAFDAASEGAFPGNDAYAGQATAAIVTDLTFEDGRAEETVVLGAGETPVDATAALESGRQRSVDDVVAAKREWFDDLLADAPMPNTDDERIQTVCNRALVTLVTNVDRETGAVVASIATQPPYGEDWPRDGAFFNHALDLVGLHEFVDTHNRWYADLQQRTGDPNEGSPQVPPGNWAMNYYADGAVGGPVPWEIDQTGFTVWTLWDHYEATGDREYLEAVYPAIEAAADFFVEYRDPENGMQQRAHEDDNAAYTQTVVGAAPVWLALDSAVRAASELGNAEASSRYEARKRELGDAIDAETYDEEAGGYTKDPDVPRPGGIPVAPFPGVYAPVAWPVCFKPFDDDRMQTHLETLWEGVSETFEQPKPDADGAFGGYELKALVALAKAWKDDDEKLARVREGIDWVAHEHARESGIIGEFWMVHDGDVVSINAQPHTWEQTLFYLATLEAYPPTDVAARAEQFADCGGVIVALRERDRGRSDTAHGRGR